MNIIAILIIAGGESRRMGSPKALLPLFDGTILLTYHIDNAKSLNLPILIGDNDKFTSFYQHENVVAVGDYIRGAGALSCLLGAMNYCQNNLIDDILNPSILVLSCDTLIDVRKLYLRLNIQVNQLACYLFDSSTNKDYPLLGIYSLSLMDELKRYLDKGERSVMKFLMDKTCRKITMPQTWIMQANFNTPQAFKRAMLSFTNESWIYEFNTCR